MHVVICGAGVIGAAIAYELSRRDVEVTIVERWRAGGAASGKSGGFLARDWCDGTPVQELARRSFDLHREWAAALGNPYGFREVDTFSAALSLRRRLSGHADGSLAPWLSPDAVHRRRIGTPSTTAQLDPEAFTRALVDAAVGHGATLRIEAVSGLRRTGDGASVDGVLLVGGDCIACDAVVLALGPWSLLAARWIPLPAIHGLKGHSVVFRPRRPLPAEAIFAEVEDAGGDVHTPEIVPRADGTLYVCGLPGDDPLPVDPSRVLPEGDGCKRLRDIAVRLVPDLADAEILAEQACHRPIAVDGVPVIGKVDGSDGVYVATGHSVWGMLNAPGTGEAMADLILDGRSRHVDLSPFRPSRLPALDPGHLSVASEQPTVKRHLPQ